MRAIAPLLVLWLLFSLIALPGLDYESVVNWIHNPLVAVPLMLMIVSIFMHLRLGMQVMLEDYVHDKGLAFFSMLAAPVLLICYLVIAAGGGADAPPGAVGKRARAGLPAGPASGAAPGGTDDPGPRPDGA